MAAPLTSEGEALARQALQDLMGALLARHDLRRDPRLQNMLLACRLRLRALQNMVLCAREEFLPTTFVPCELREFTADLCAAANMLLAPLGRAVRFRAPEEPMEALCAPRDVASLVLELICNCALHCPGEEIHVSLRPLGKKHNRAFVLTAECAGPLDLTALHAGILRAGSGAAAMQSVARLHRGALLWLERGGKSVAAFRLSGGQQGRASDCYAAPDYVELLSDPCSPVYIALAPALGG